VWENLFRELAGNGRATDTQMIDSTHVKATPAPSLRRSGAPVGEERSLIECIAGPGLAQQQ
jgi:hypothetical protein